MANFYQDVIMKDPRFHSAEICKDMMLLEPVTRAAVEAIMAEAKSTLDIDLRVTETYRSPARQQHLFATGATQLKECGTHSYGLATDFFKLVNGKAEYGGDWNFLRDLANKHGLLSGVDWGHPERKHTFRDLCHVQRVNVTDQTKLFAGTWYPDDAYRPDVVVIS